MIPKYWCRKVDLMSKVGPSWILHDSIYVAVGNYWNYFKLYLICNDIMALYPEIVICCFRLKYNQILIIIYMIFECNIKRLIITFVCRRLFYDIYSYSSYTIHSLINYGKIWRRRLESWLMFIFRNDQPLGSDDQYFAYKLARERYFPSAVYGRGAWKNQVKQIPFLIMTDAARLFAVRRRERRKKLARPSTVISFASRPFARKVKT